MSWVFENKEWLFSGVGVVILGYFVAPFFPKKGEPEKTVPAATGSSNISNIDIKINHQNSTPSENNSIDKSIGSRVTPKKTLNDFKNETRILFVDDDARFKVTKILVKSGWVHTKLIKDCETLDDRDIVDASILFIDVQGVGVAMGFGDEGLGLALAIKKKYPTKKVIIYSAETKGDRFHEALRKADSFLAKNADPYEFQRIVEEFTIGIDS
jgi:hypothetical protein